MLIINIEKIFVWSWAIGNMGFHLNEVVFVSINVELLTLRVCFIFKIIVDPFAVGRGIFLSHFATSRGWKEFTFALFFLFLLFFNFLLV